ncbi:9578_t:CDS:10, partial [Acaulospora colombiana]
RNKVSQKSITPEGLLLQGFTALESLKPHSAMHADWQHLLERLEQLTLGASSGTAKQPYEVNGTSGEAALSLDVGSEDAPKRCVTPRLWLAAQNDGELPKYNSLVSQVDKYCRKSTATSGSSPPTMASDKGSTSSLSVPAYETDVPIDLFPEESTSQPSPTTLVTSLARSGFPPKKEPPPRHPASNLHGTSIDENSAQEVIIKPLRTPKSPSSVMQGRDLQGPLPVLQHPRMQPTHRHSRSLPVLRPVTKISAPPPLPPLDLKRTTSKNVRHSLSYNGKNHVYSPHIPCVPDVYLCINSSYSFPCPENRTPKLDTELSNAQRRPEPRSPTRPDPQERWTIHDRDSWEVVPPVPPSKSPRHSSTHLPHSSSGEPTSPTGSSKPRGLGLLRRRLSKTQLSIKTGPRASISNLGSPGHPLPIPVNVNTVVMGPIGCGVSTLIQKFMANEFYHHVVKSESRTVYYNITEVTGSEEYVDLRRAVLRRAQVVILCFRLDSRTQFRDAIVRLVEDIHTIGEIPIILVGTFQDIADREAQTAAEALHASYFECSPLLSHGINEIFNHAADILRNADEIRPPAATAMQPPSATKNLFNLVRNRRAYSTSSPRMKSQNHYVSHSASSKQQTFAEATTPVPVMNIAPNSPAINGNVLLLSPQHFKCVIMGGKSSGRKSLVHRYLHGAFEWLPEVPWMTWKAAVNVVPLENERRPSLPIIGSTVPYALTISETAPIRELDSLRKITYIGTSVFVICFSVSDHREEVMQEIQERWAEECRLYNPTIPIIVVATKVDQRAGTLRAWTKAQGEALSRSIRAAAYLECSAATGEGIETVFQTIIRVATETHLPTRV